MGSGTVDGNTGVCGQRRGARSDWRNDYQRCRGAWNVLPGVSQAFIGRSDAGPVTLKWRLPGGKEPSKEVELEKAGTLKVEIK